MVAGWIKKIAINKGKEYARNWVMEHKFLVGFGKQTLPFQLILSIRIPSPKLHADLVILTD